MRSVRPITHADVPKGIETDPIRLLVGTVSRRKTAVNPFPQEWIIVAQLDSDTTGPPSSVPITKMITFTSMTSNSMLMIVLFLISECLATFTGAKDAGNIARHRRRRLF